MESTELKSALDEYHATTSDGLQSLNDKIDAQHAEHKKLAATVDAIETKVSRPGSVSREKPNPYSLLNLVRKLADPRANVDVGYEMEQHQELVGKMQAPPGTVLVPFDALTAGLERKAVSVAGSGGNMVATDYLDDRLIELLRAESIVAGLGATVLGSLRDNVNIPKRMSGHTGYWFTGDGLDEITESEPTFDVVNMGPTFLGGLSVWSLKFVTQATPALEVLAQRDLIQTLTTEMDRAVLQGSGSGNEPTGLVNLSGIHSDTYADSHLSPTFREVVSMETAIRDANVRGDLAYATTPAVAGALKMTDKAVDNPTGGYSGKFIYEGGRMNDLPVAVSNNVPTNHVICGKWSDLLIGVWGSGIALRADESAYFASGKIRIRAIMACDIKVRHEESFAEMHPA